jgi:CubicO group peptidase (beta-lactamase class C family)
MTTKAKACIFALLLILAPLAARPAEPGLAGHWSGSVELPGTKLECRLDFSRSADGTLTGSVTIPAQNAKDLPLGRIVVQAGEVSFAITGLPGDPVFKGTLDEAGLKITGTLTQSGQAFPFVFTRSESPADKAKAALAGFDDLVARGLKSLNVPGAAVAIVKDNEVILAKGYGFRDVEKKAPMTADTLLAIGSASKAFTVFALGTLVDAGKLQWDVPLRTYIPWFKLYDVFASERLSPRDLVTHRSGLPRHDLVWYNNSTASREEFVRRLAYLKPSADLREKWQYNNLMFLTAGYLVEVLTGKKWEDSIRSLVLAPLGMSRTNFSVEDSQRDADCALPYVEEKGVLTRIPFRNITNIGPAGAINSSANEMSRWLLVHMNGGRLNGQPIIQPGTIEDMHLVHMPTGQTPSIPELTPENYGMGWFTDSYKGRLRVHHGGNIDGFSALVCFFPRDGLGLVVLTNMNGTGLPELLVRHAADVVLGLEPKDWIGEAAALKAKGEDLTKESEQKKASRRVPGTKPSHKLEDYAGTYHHPGYGDLRVSLDKGQLTMAYNGIVNPLEHWHYDTWSGIRVADPTFADMKLNFVADRDGNIARVEAPFEPTIDDIIFEKKPDARLSDPAYLARFVGRYQLLEQVFSVDLRGNVLIISAPGSPATELEPALGGVFVLKAARSILIRMKTDASGRVSALEILQPSGVYEAKRIK